jgi:hypothetical protein
VITILAVKLGLAVLNGDSTVCIGDVLSVHHAGTPWARLVVIVEGPFPVVRISRLQTGITPEVLVGMEAEPEGEPCPNGPINGAT